MLLEDIPLYTIMPEASGAVTDFLLKKCNSVEFLGAEHYGLRDVENLRNTKYADIIPSLISVREGCLWGIDGKIFKFGLTNELKAHLRREGLTCMFRDGDIPLLENLTMYSDNKQLFSCCSHETFVLPDMSNIDDGLREDLLKATDEGITNSPLYSQMLAINEKLERSDEEINSEISILFDLPCFVDREKKMWLYSIPSKECSFSQFRKIAKDYLTSQTFRTLKNAKSYSSLQPLPVARTIDEIVNNSSGIEYAPQFNKTDYYNRIKRELCLLQYIRQHA